MPQPAPGIVGNVRGEPALEIRAAQTFAAFVSAQDRFRRMAGAAVTGPLDQECPAIPFRTVLWIGMEFALLEIERIPGAHSGSDVEGKHQPASCIFGMNRRHGVEE